MKSVGDRVRDGFINTIDRASAITSFLYPIC